jgi:hypothetical protein
MPTIQSDDPNEDVNHPRRYNQHPSGIECVEINEHLPSNIACAVRYLWRLGLKTTTTPLRDAESALWYTEREQRRRRLFDIGEDDLHQKTDIVWRALASQLREVDDKSPLAVYLRHVLDDDLTGAASVARDEVLKLRRAGK